MKTLIVTLAFLGVLQYSFGQSIKSIAVGPKIGLNVSSWGGDDFNTKSKTGIHLGAFAQARFSKQFSVQPELFYSAQGTKCSCTSSNIPVNYLNFPVLVKVDVYKGLYLNAGPQIAFLLSAKDGDDDSAEDEFKGTDFSFVIGAGYELPLGIHVHLRYNIGLSNINSEDFDENTKSQVFQVGVGFLPWKKDYQN